MRLDTKRRRLRPMLGLKSYGHAALTVAGVELLHRIRKNQFALSRLRVRGSSTPEIRNAARLLSTDIPSRPQLVLKTQNCNRTLRTSILTDPLTKRCCRKCLFVG
jgi:hypothetical protein